MSCDSHGRSNSCSGTNVPSSSNRKRFYVPPSLRSLPTHLFTFPPDSFDLTGNNNTSTPSFNLTSLQYHHQHQISHQHPPQHFAQHLPTNWYPPHPSYSQQALAVAQAQVHVQAHVQAQAQGQQQQQTHYTFLQQPLNNTTVGMGRNTTHRLGDYHNQQQHMQTQRSNTSPSFATLRSSPPSTTTTATASTTVLSTTTTTPASPPPPRPSLRWTTTTDKDTTFWTKLSTAIQHSHATMLESSTLLSLPPSSSSLRSPAAAFRSDLTQQDLVRVQRTTTRPSQFSSSSTTMEERGQQAHEHDLILGAGSFSVVTCIYLKTKKTNYIKKNDDDDSSSSIHSSSLGSSTDIRKKQPVRRQYYALKHLQRALLPNSNDQDERSATFFIKATTELAREGYLLRHLQHRHIIAIKGWTAGGVASYGTGQRHDSFFLVLELLAPDTLEDRIQRWNQEDSMVMISNQQQQHVQQHPVRPSSSSSSIAALGSSYAAPLSMTTSSPEEKKRIQNRRRTDDQQHQRTLEKLLICAQLANALDYLHSKNVVYRDLKPENVGFALPRQRQQRRSEEDDDPCYHEESHDHKSHPEDDTTTTTVQVKLMDFGLARELPTTTTTSGTIFPSALGYQENMNRTGTENNQAPQPTTATTSCCSTTKTTEGVVSSSAATAAATAAAAASLFDMTGTVGTIRYMAPEVFCQQQYGLACDIYSWSIVAYQLLTQVKPYEEFTTVESFRTFVCVQGVRPSKSMMTNLQFAHEYHSLLGQAWRHDPSQRLSFHCIQRQLEVLRQQEEEHNRRAMWKVPPQELVGRGGDGSGGSGGGVSVSTSQHVHCSSDEHLVSLPNSNTTTSSTARNGHHSNYCRSNNNNKRAWDKTR